MKLLSNFKLWLRSFVFRNSTLWVLWLSPTVPEPPRKQFTANRYHRSPPDHVVWLGFQRDKSPLPNKFNTIAIIERPNVWIRVAVPDCDSLVKPIAPSPEHVTPGDMLAEFCDYVVEVPCSYDDKPRRAPIIGPLTCTVLAKRMIGMHDSSITTAAELLDALWRNQWQGQ